MIVIVSKAIIGRSNLNSTDTKGIKKKYAYMYITTNTNNPSNRYFFQSLQTYFVGLTSIFGLYSYKTNSVFSKF